MNKKISILYITAVLILFAIPMYVVLSNFNTLTSGTEYKFKVEAFDPYDMFRGNYININFDEHYIRTITNTPFFSGEDYYVSIEEGKDGFAYFNSITDVKPENSDYYKSIITTYRGGLYVETPNKYYMNEKKSMQAELIYNKNINNTYVKVRVKDGNMVIVGVYINNILIDSLVE